MNQLQPNNPAPRVPLDLWTITATEFFHLIESFKEVAASLDLSLTFVGQLCTLEGQVFQLVVGDAKPAYPSRHYATPPRSERHDRANAGTLMEDAVRKLKDVSASRILYPHGLNAISRWLLILPNGVEVVAWVKPQTENKPEKPAEPAQEGGEGTDSAPTPQTPPCGQPGDESAPSDIKAGAVRDPYRELAARMLSTPPEDVTEVQMRIAKIASHSRRGHSQLVTHGDWMNAMTALALQASASATYANTPPSTPLLDKKFAAGKNSPDIFTQAAATLTNKPVEEVTPEQRDAVHTLIRSIHSTAYSPTQLTSDANHVSGDTDQPSAVTDTGENNESPKQGKVIANPNQSPKEMQSVQTENTDPSGHPVLEDWMSRVNRAVEQQAASAVIPLSHLRPVPEEPAALTPEEFSEDIEKTAAEAFAALQPIYAGDRVALTKQISDAYGQRHVGAEGTVINKWGNGTLAIVAFDGDTSHYSVSIDRLRRLPPPSPPAQLAPNVNPDWSEAEREAIARLAKEKDMSPQGVLRQALRAYQSRHLTPPRSKPNSMIEPPSAALYRGQPVRVLGYEITHTHEERHAEPKYHIEDREGNRFWVLARHISPVTPNA